MKARVLRTRVNQADSTPEDALKTFYLALRAQDGEALRAVTLADDEFPWLLRGRPASPSDLAQMKSRLEQTSMKRLKPGDVARMADGESQTLKPDDLRAGRAVIWPEGSSHALRLEDVGGHWKVERAALHRRPQGGGGQECPAPAAFPRIAEPRRPLNPRRVRRDRFPSRFVHAIVYERCDASLSVEFRRLLLGAAECREGEVSGMRGDP